MRKINLLTAIVLVAALLFTACRKDEPENNVNNDQNQTEDTGATDDTGEVEVPDYTYDYETKTYTVYTTDGLLAWNVAVQDTLELNCTLAADINLTDSTWTLVGNSSNPYTGTFEGGGHTITGLTIDQEQTYNVGLIGCLGSGGKVQNLTLDNVSITGYQYVGGVVGSSYSGTVTNCSVSGSVNGASNEIGGVVGYNNGGTVTACAVSGSVLGSVSYSWYVGGVVGYHNSGTVTACYSTGDVSGNYNVGGVVGANYDTVTACYHASGSISGSSRVGGVVGYHSSTWGGTVTACYWSDYDGYGIGSGNGSATEVGSEDCATWLIAQEAMNEALANADSEWRYENAGASSNAGDAPTLTKNSSE